MNKLTFFFGLTAFIPIAARGDLVECDGTWTNKPCPVVAATAIPEVTEDVRLDDPEYPKKKAVVDGVRSYTNQLLTRGLAFPSEEIIQFCLDPSNSYEACSQRFDEKRRYFDERLDVQAVSTPQSSSSSSDDSDQTNTVIIHRPIYIEEPVHVIPPILPPSGPAPGKPGLRHPTRQHRSGDS